MRHECRRSGARPTITSMRGWALRIKLTAPKARGIGHDADVRRRRQRSFVRLASRSEGEFRQSAPQRFHELGARGLLRQHAAFCCSFRVTGAAKQLAVEAAKPPGGRKEPEPGTITHHDAGRFRTDFDNIGLRHIPLAFLWPEGRADNGQWRETFPVARTRYGHGSADRN